MNTGTCPSCGAQVSTTGGTCLFCGAALAHATQPAATAPKGIPGTRRASAMDMEISAFSVTAAERVGVLQDHEAAALRAELMASDLGGTWWTFVGDSRQWFRSQGGAWVRADRPPEVFIKDALFDRIQQLTLATLERVGTVPASQAEPPRGPQFCGKCGQALRPGKKFCVNCGTAAPS